MRELYFLAASGVTLAAPIPANTEEQFSENYNIEKQPGAFLLGSAVMITTDKATLSSD